MKRFACLIVMLLVTHGITLSMMYGRKIINKTTSLKLNRSYIELERQRDKFLQHLQASSMDADSRGQILGAYRDAIYKVAQIEAMCKIYSTPNLDANERKALLGQVKYIVRE